MPCWLLLSLLAAPADGPWTLCGPGGGGWIQSLAYSPHEPQTRLIGCDVGGFYRSDDGGKAYRIQNAGLRDRYLEAIVPDPVNPRRIYVATLSGVHRSDDGGQTWRWLRDGFPATSLHAYTAPIGSLAIDPVRPDTLYAGIGIPRSFKGGQGAIYRTIDGGEHWTRFNPPGSLPDDALVSSILIRADGLLVATQHGVYHGSADGRTWTLSSEGMAKRHARTLASSPANPQRVYCTADTTPGQPPFDGGVYRSDDGGTSWRRIIEGLNTYVRDGERNHNLSCQYDKIVVSAQDADLVWVGGDAWVNAGLWKSTDGGEHWTPVFNRPTKDAPGNVDVGYITFWGPSVKCLAIDPHDGNRVMFGTSGMVYETTDGGQTFGQRYTKDLGDGQWTGTGLEVTCLWSIACHPTRRDGWYLGYMDIGLWRTDDAGQALRRCMTGVQGDHSNCGQAVAFDPDDPDHLWGGFGQWGSNRGGVYESHDAGSTWSPIDGLPDAAVVRLLVDPNSPKGHRSLFVALTGQGVFHGSAGKFTKLSQGWPGGGVSDLDLHDGRPVALVDGANDTLAGLWRWTGQTWARIDTAPFIGYGRELAIAPSDPNRWYLAVRERYVQGKVWPGGLFASRDAGATWSQGFADRFIDSVAVGPADAETVILGEADHPYHDQAIGCGVRLSRDGGATWQEINDNLGIHEVPVIVFDPLDPERVIVGTAGNSFWWRRLPAR